MSRIFPCPASHVLSIHFGCKGKKREGKGGRNTEMEKKGKIREGGTRKERDGGRELRKGEGEKEY